MFMKAVVNEKFGPPNVLQIKEIEKPVPTGHEVLIKTYVSSVNTIDIVFRSGMKAMFGLARITTGIRSPKRKITGFDLSGEIVAIGDAVTDFKVGDYVFGGCKTGSSAEFALADDSDIALKPVNITFEEAAAIPMAGLSALQALKPLNIQSGMKILIYGASGGIGTYAVQLAKFYGAHVTGVASGKNKDLVLGLGADVFIDYQVDNVTNQKEKFDIAFDTVAKLKGWKKVLTKNGIFINAGSPTMSMFHFFTSQWGNRFRKKHYITFNTSYKKDDLEFLAQLEEKGKLRSVIDKIYSFDDLPEAHRYYETHHVAGKVVVQISNLNKR